MTHERVDDPGKVKIGFIRTAGVLQAWAPNYIPASLLCLTAAELAAPVQGLQVHVWILAAQL